jgi:hypothetical protein
MLKRGNSYQTDPLQYIAKLVNAYNEQFDNLILETFSENRRCCISHKDKLTSGHNQHTFMNMLLNGDQFRP